MTTSIEGKDDGAGYGVRGQGIRGTGVLGEVGSVREARLRAVIIDYKREFVVSPS
jgi:hypothetical protein